MQASAGEPHGILEGTIGAFSRALGVNWPVPAERVGEPEHIEAAPPNRADAAFQQFMRERIDSPGAAAERSLAAIELPPIHKLNPGRALDWLHAHAIAPPPRVLYLTSGEQPMIFYTKLPKSDAALELPVVRGVHPGNALDGLVSGRIAQLQTANFGRSFTPAADLSPEFRALARKVDLRAADLEDEGEYAAADRLREVANILRDKGREMERVLTPPQVYSTPQPKRRPRFP